MYTHMCPNVLMLHTLDHDLHLHFLQSNAQLLSEIATTKHNQQSKQIERTKGMDGIIFGMSGETVYAS